MKEGILTICSDFKNPLMQKLPIRLPSTYCRTLPSCVGISQHPVHFRGAFLWRIVIRHPPASGSVSYTTTGMKTQNCFS